MKFPAIARFKSAADFGRRLAEVSSRFGAPLTCDDSILPSPESPLAQPIEIAGRQVGNRFAIHPMEGWDAMRDGTPSQWTLRRWRNFGLSGAKLLWGGEAVAVSHEARANPHQLFYRPENEAGLASLLQTARSAHREAFGGDEDLLVGLQLTHSGRFSRPDRHDLALPRTAHAHPVLDPRFGVHDSEAMLTDGDLEAIGEKFVAAASAAAGIGFDFVDIKHCHGYLLHELLAAKTRPGRYGGSFENRTRMLREIVAGIRTQAPQLAIGVRLSLYDVPPAPESDATRYDPEDYTFGLMNEELTDWNRTEPFAFLALCEQLGISMVNLSAGVPYYSAHVQRPAAYPPIDSREPLRDPLIGVTRLIQATRECRRAFPAMVLVGTGYSYLQEYLPHVAQAQVREGHVDFIGLGRMALAYPTLPADVLSSGELKRTRLCRTFSDCTNGPRMGFISGCYPLDPDYRSLAERKRIQARKKLGGDVTSIEA